MRIAIVGGGIFGTTIAWNLAKYKLHVDVYESNRDILCGASAINQYRIHQGYHYPRSDDTAQSTRYSAPSFLATYPEANISHYDHFYCIASEHSLTNAEEYLEFLRRNELDYEEITPPSMVKPNKVELCVKVRENLFDPDVLRELIRERLNKYGVKVIHQHATRALMDNYDLVILATYSRNNEFLSGDTEHQQQGQFEVCEKPIVRLPDIYSGVSLVMMDGPFMCFDPLGETDQFVLGNVVHAIHHTNVGELAEIPQELEPFINQGHIGNPPVTRIGRFIESAAEFFVDFGKAEHIASMYTVRTVLPNHEDDDARPTLVRRIHDNLISVFSGKIDTCQITAEEVLNIIEHKSVLEIRT